MEPVIRPLREKDLTEADRILRLSIGTFLGMADPMKFLAIQTTLALRWPLNLMGNW